MIPINDEDDKNELKQIFDKYSRIMINGRFPGVGKTTAVLSYEGHKILFVPPYNKLCQQIKIKGHDAATLNMLMGFYGEGEDYKQFKSFNVDPYDCICYDEILI